MGLNRPMLHRPNGPYFSDVDQFGEESESGNCWKENGGAGENRTHV